MTRLIDYVVKRKDADSLAFLGRLIRMMPYERFDAWKLCHKLALDIYRLTRTFPADERFALTAQARRAAFSAAANIVEGCVKKGPREFRRFLDISIGSLGEVRYILQLAGDLDYIPPDKAKEIIQLHTRASQTTWALYKSMGQRNIR